MKLLLSVLSLIYVCVGWTTTVNAQQVDSRFGNQLNLIEISIPKQPVGDALNEFAAKSGLQIVFYSDIADGLDSNSISGEYKNQDEALAALLHKSGLNYNFLNDHTVAIQSAVSDSREVTEPGKHQPTSSQLLMAQTQTSVNQTSPTGEGPQTSNDDDVQSRFYEEVLVTAQIREENLQVIPVSGTAFTGAAIEVNRLLEIDDIARFTPGLTGSFFNYSSPIIAVRGANNTFSQAGAGKPVGVFLDGVFIPRYSASSFELFDLQQVTVLRGPQGTLFGRNVTGGAIQINTRQPNPEYSESRFRVGAGNYNLVEVSGYATGPLSEAVAGKVVISYKNRDGFAVDRFNGQALEDLDSLNIRAGLAFSAGENVEVRLATDYASDESGGRSFSFLSSSDGSNLTGNDGDNRTAELRVPQSYERNIKGLSAHVDWALENGTIRSITGYRQSDAHEIYSLGAADVTLPSVSTQFLKDEIDNPSSFSQEIQFVSDRFTKFDFVTGLYYYTEDTDRYVGDILFGVNGNAVFVDRFFNVNAKTTSIAAYANATIRLGDKFELGIGGRYTNEDKEVSVEFVDNNRPGNNFFVAPSNDFSEFTPRITLSYFPSDSLTLFASRTEGFTAGGFNTETNNSMAIQLGFDPETITAFELGAKSTWAGGRLIANLTLFDQEYENKQEGFFTPAGPFFSIFNASKASMSGAELELNWAMTDSLSASVTYSALDTKYDSFVIPLGPDFTGNKLQTAPESKGSVALDYSTELANGNSLDAGFSYSWQDEYYTGASNVPDFLIDSYSLINARLGYSWDSGRWRIDLWGKNLGDEDYVRIRGNSGALAEFFGAPRTYGISLTYQGK